jgi:predicted peroxiredoxin
MKTPLAAALALALSALPVAAEQPARLVTILTAPEPQTQLMAMVLSMQAAQAGTPPHILLCGPAGDLALAEAPESATAPQPPRGMSPQGLMKMIMQQPGAKVEVCAIYLPGRGEGPEVLLEGVTVATPPEMAATIIAADSRVMSF